MDDRDLGREVAAHFGTGGVRRFAPREIAFAPLPPGAAGVLTGPGLPLRAGPYFTATAGEPLPLGEYAASAGVPGAAAASARWCRLGTDRGAEICAGPDGDVRALFVVADIPAMTVNGSVRAFVASLLALDRHLPPLASPEHDPSEVLRALRAALRRIDGPALEDDESWWPRVLEEIRHELSFPFAAAFEYEDAHGEKRVETEHAQVGLAHPERLLWDRLEAAGVRPGQVTRVYTELEPCLLPGNYCALWLTKFRDAELTHSFDYGATAEAREQGILELVQQATDEG